MDETTRKILSTAKGFVAAGWRQGGYEDESGGRCVMKALLDAAGLEADACSWYGSFKPSRVMIRLHDVLAATAGVASHDPSRDEYHDAWPLSRWNDTKGRTQGDVIAVPDWVLADTAPLPDTFAEPSEGELARYHAPSPYDWAAGEDFA